MPYYHLKIGYQQYSMDQYATVPTILYQNAKLDLENNIIPTNVYLHDSTNDKYLFEYRGYGDYQFTWSTLYERKNKADDMDERLTYRTTHPYSFRVEKIDNNTFVLYYMSGYGDANRKCNYLAKRNDRIISTLNKSDAMMFYVKN